MNHRAWPARVAPTRLPPVTFKLFNLDASLSLGGLGSRRHHARISPALNGPRRRRRRACRPWGVFARRCRDGDSGWDRRG